MRFESLKISLGLESLAISGQKRNFFMYMKSFQHYLPYFFFFSSLIVNSKLIFNYTFYV